MAPEDETTEPEPAPEPLVQGGAESEGDAYRELVRSGAGDRVDRLPSTHDLAKQDRQQDIKLKRIYGGSLLALVLVQIVIADGVFFVYGAQRDWDVPGNVMQTWLAATVVEVIAMVTVVVRYLFPRRDLT